MNQEPPIQRSGILCVVSGPSGSGKTTLCRAFSASDKDAVYATSATTRPAREGEMDGEDYFFLSREEFENRCTSGEFLEFAEVHGNLYGTLKSEVLDHIQKGRDVLMDLDVQGAERVRGSDDPIIQGALVDVFILPPNDRELIKRLNSRGTESQEQLDLRLHNAREEMLHWRKYAYSIISCTKEADFATFQSIVRGERCRSHRLLDHSIAHDDRQQELEL